MLLKEADLSKQYFNLRNAEEAFYRQKSRVQWINLGDKNTQFFCRVVKAKRAKSTIKVLFAEDGEKLTDIQDIQYEVVEFYKTLLGSANSNISGGSVELLQSILHTFLNFDGQHELIKPITAEEIKATMFSLNGNKAPRPDGHTSEFSKTSWSIVGAEVTEAILNFFSNSKMLKEVNATNITLVPKSPNANKMVNFRPTTCCSTIYKCISKFLLIN